MSNEPVTLADVKIILEQRLTLRDPELGHVLDDELLTEVVKQTAVGNPEAQAIARTVTAFYDEHKFERWYA